ncbi:hypothetical protein HYG86_12925 [Alkalicella caledoniensis]|uniref:Uncharacterized protein n=1 Tax=Alkalicella caledoniensis TaxID=2731377 RepID=A0A7G9WA99_ALKCA|nr:hypothetical protein [Alkalicella caledoniensis]QNO15611.1 hypothetical protein HYG86_12925 [Alkalicella caledoniensis]
MKKVFFSFLIVLILVFSIRQIWLHRNNEETKPVMFGQGTVITKGDGEPHEGGFNLELDNNFFDYNIKFMNFIQSDQVMEFGVLIFIDYEQVVYEVNGEEYDMYVFEVGGDEEVSIPVRFRVKEESSNFFYLIIDNPYEYSNRKYESLSMRYQFNERKKLDEINYMIGEKFNENNGIEVSMNKDSFSEVDKINANQGEDVELYLAYGGDYGGGIAENYLIFFMLDWSQKSLNEEHKYLNLKLDEGSGGIIKVTFQAPNAPGEYEAVFYQIPNPWVHLERGQNTLLFPNETRRLVLTVR